MEQYAELWGTFAVDDHLRPRPFVAEAVIFDRLVIPTPMGWSKEDLKEWPASWHAETLKPLIDLLGDRAIAKPWNEKRRDEWKKRFAEFESAPLAGRQQEAHAIAFDTDNIRNTPADTPAKFLTREVLRDELDLEDEALLNKLRSLPLPPTSKAEVVAAYGSYAQFRQEIAQGANADTVPLNETDPRDALLLTWDIFVPEDSDLSDIALLEKVLKLDQNVEFVEHRRRFQDLRREMVTQQISPIEARKEIEERLVAYNAILADVATLSIARRVLTYAAIGAPLMDFIVPGLGTASGVTLGLASHIWKSWAPNPEVGPKEAQVAMIQDLRDEFDFK